MDSRRSIFLTLVVILVSIVVAAIFSHAVWSYFKEKDAVVQKMQAQSMAGIKALERNVGRLIGAYAVNEYEKLIETEIEHADYLAIIVRDFNMGKVLGGGAHVTGKIRLPSGELALFDRHSPEHLRQLRAGSFVITHPVTTPQGVEVGSISIHMPGDAIEAVMADTIDEYAGSAVALSAVLIAALFISLHGFILQPIAKLVSTLRNTDSHGIPRLLAPGFRTSEMNQLADSVNTMISSIRSGRDELHKQHEYLQMVIDGVDDPIMVIRADYSISLMNGATRKLANMAHVADPDTPKCYEVSHHRSMPCDGLAHPCPLVAVMNTRKSAVVVHQHHLVDGLRYVELSASPLLDDQQQCTGIIEVARDITVHLATQDRLREQQQSLRYQASHDSLTGLANRFLFDDRLERSLERAKREKSRVAVLFIDLDHFKKINDSLGHKAGDQILRVVTTRFSQTVRKEDTLARLGGDEFTVLMEGLHEPNDASLLSEKILRALAEPVVVDGQELYVSCSIGISIYPDNGDSGGDLLKFADAAMYRAKAEGRNSFRYYSADLTEQAFERLLLEGGLRSALKNGEFVLHYQPQVDARSDAITGMEALIRWQHPKTGWILPSDFIPVAESTGLIVEIDRFVIFSVMRQLVRWADMGLRPGRVAVNLSVKQLRCDDFVDFLEEAFRSTACRPDWLEIEITEGQIMVDPEQAISILNRISDLGVRLSVDDFGTGYSSLAYLKKLPIHKLKIDQSFVRGLPDNESDAAIAKAVIALAHSLNLQVLAEGVETRQQQDFLLANGCETIQGYLCCRPAAAATITELLRSESGPAPGAAGLD